jgi:hypothetical protein
MMKNMEWAAIVYLSLSKYGINNDINNNNNSNYLTGYSAVIGTNQSTYPGVSGTSTDVTLPYNTETGYLASTTGNISGIYDMSGGTHEYLATYVDGAFNNSGFSADTISIYDTKYFDIYPSDSESHFFKTRKLGDATTEFGPFYSFPDYDEGIRCHNGWWGDHVSFIDSNSSWLARGGRYSSGNLAGQLHYNGLKGNKDSYLGFRIVLVN